MNNYNEDWDWSESCEDTFFWSTHAGILLQFDRRPAYADRVKETTTSTGIGTLTLSGVAVAGNRTFAAAVRASGDGNISDGGTTFICIEDPITNDFEVCDTIYDMASNTVTRGTLRSSSTGARISLAAGTKNVNIVVPAFMANNHFRQAVEVTPSGTVDGVNKTFTLADVPAPGTQKLYQNSTRLFVGIDYAISGLTITMTVAPITGDVLRCDYSY